MRRVARKSCVLADHTKIGSTAFARNGSLADVDYFITNLAAGDTIDIIVSSVQIDPFLIIDYPQAQAQEVQH